VLSRWKTVKVSNGDQKFRILAVCGGVMHREMRECPFAFAVDEEIYNGVVEHGA
jgi:hypothetical protein